MQRESIKQANFHFEMHVMKMSGYIHSILWNMLKVPTRDFLFKIEKLIFIFKRRETAEKCIPTTNFVQGKTYLIKFKFKFKNI